MASTEDMYNLVVIGGGAAGLVSSYIAATVKAKVALVEKHRMGGDCLYTGCVPSKSLIKTARIVHQIRQHKTYGIKSAQCELDFAEVMDRIQSVIKKIEPHDSVERYTGIGVDCIKGEAELIDENTVKVGKRILKTKSIILALGASPFVPPIKGLSSIPILTSENLWELRQQPKKLLVLGAGPIGCEMAQAFQRLGTEVSVLEAGPRILPREDDDVASILTQCFKNEGVRLFLGTKAIEVISENGHSI
ncbi:MAG: FAD-dependent oxidoreductase, partial [Proteobacteria bacterium]|nr:FAD-dependent oxidoreductase [Pseudomonadota bacterium]